MPDIVSEIGKATVRFASMVGVLGTTKRALGGWVKKRYPSLISNAFGREAVNKRNVYVDLGHQDLTDRFVKDIEAKRQALLWICGSGGTGKSTLAFEIARRVAKVGTIVPVIVDSSWQKASLQEYVAKELTAEQFGERPSLFMVQKLLKQGLVLLVVDGFSEIKHEDSNEQIITAFGRGDIRHVVVASRGPCPDPQHAHEVTLGNIPMDQLAKFVARYVENDEQCQPILSALKSFSARQEMNPLFARIAIEEALRGQDLPHSRFELVQKYVRGLRTATPSSPSEGDFLRACRLSAFACLEGSFTPHDASEDFLRGVLDTEENRSAFYDEKGSKIDPFALIAFLRACGILQSSVARAVQRIDFVYHPVAEYLAAAHVTTLPEESRIYLLGAIRSSAIASSTFLEAINETLEGSMDESTNTASDVAT